MQVKSDAQLLRDYAEHGHEAAFREIVTRHTDLVYSAALRQLESADQAADVAQSVFVDLARKAKPVGDRLSAGASLVGWLYRSTRFAALTRMRDDRRRAAHERLAMEQLLTNSESPPAWEHVRPLLDDALDGLDDTDREAVLLRYFKNHDLRSVGAALGVSDDAAQKRVSRAVERLREFFGKRGIAVGASGLTVIISANAIQAAPTGLVVTISTAALAGTAATTTTVIAATTKTIAMTTLQKTLVTATVAVLAGAGIYEARQAAQLRDQVQALQQQQTPLAEQVLLLSEALTRATNQLSSLREDNERLNRNTSELLRLRNAVGRLKSDVRDSEQVLRDPNVQQQLASQARATKLEDLLTQMPQQRIPELSLLDQRAYLDVARDADLTTEEGVRTALSRLRFVAENQAAIKLQAALFEFVKSSEGKPPARPSDLAALIDPPIDNAIFDRYEIVETGTNVTAGWAGGWILTQKQPVDASHDQRWLMSPVGFTSSGWEKETNP